MVAEGHHGMAAVKEQARTGIQESGSFLQAIEANQNAECTGVAGKTWGDHEKDPTHCALEGLECDPYV